MLKINTKTNIKDKQLVNELMVIAVENLQQDGKEFAVYTFKRNPNANKSEYIVAIERKSKNEFTVAVMTAAEAHKLKADVDKKNTKQDPMKKVFDLIGLESSETESSRHQRRPVLRRR